MDSCKFIGKQKLCYTEVSDFTNFQGIGNDPMYKRYDNVFSVVKRVVPTSYHHFLATPDYQDDDDRIFWYIENWIEPPLRLIELTGEEYNRYKVIFDDTIRNYKSSIMKLSGEDLQIMAGAIKYINEDCIYCCDNKVYIIAWGMTFDTRKHNAAGTIIHEFDCVKKFKITFETGEHGTISKLDKTLNKAKGTTFSDAELPLVQVNDGWVFIGWEPSPIGLIVESDTQFTAQYSKSEPIVEPEPIIPNDTSQEEEQFFYCSFEAGQYGMIEGISNVCKKAKSFLRSEEIPKVKPNKGYEFTGWNISPYNCLIDQDKVFTAQYKKKNPCYRRCWLWLSSLFAGKKWLKWLLWILLTLLLIWLLSLLFRSCVSCSGHRGENGVVPLDTITRDDGKIMDNNGYSHPLTGDDGTLPNKDFYVAPLLGEDGKDIPIVEQPGVPNTIANRLFLFMENESDNIELLAKDFKRTYKGEQYSIIGYDKEVKLLIVQIPENEREHIRQTINEKIPNHQFLVFDEEIYELRGSSSEQSSNPGWHIKAINLHSAWQITKGSPKIKIAVVDDGIDASHPMFKGRIIDAYNVYTQNNKLSIGEGHGTHTAGLAAGGVGYLSQGAAGIAPNCKLMPIQVFDNKKCPLSALVAGIMYAVHHGADVVNLSVCPSFSGLNALPPEQQDQIARHQFKNVEKLWIRVCSLAASKNCILVFAAGNDDIFSSIPPENRNKSAIVVTAVDINLYPTDFTNYGPCSDISAPGKDIMSSYPGGQIRPFDGTSMAAPIVAGTIALMKSLKKDLTIAQVRNVLYKTGADVCGYIPPMVLVDKALDCVKRGDFGKPTERKMKPVPNGKGGDSAAKEVLNIEEIPEETIDPIQRKNETDYEVIRRRIEEYKQKISELEELLPDKK